MTRMSLAIMVNSMSRLNRIIILSGLACISLITTIWFYLKKPIPRAELNFAIKNVLIIRDRKSIVLSRLYPEKGGFYQPVSFSDLPDHLIKALLAAEDKRYFSHKGIDLLAVARAFKDNIRNLRIVSGGSTISQQLVRIIYGRPRNFFNKIIESFLALRLEYHFSKQEILTAYLNRAFFGNNLYGIGVASQTYFGKPVKQLSVSESAFLVSILKSGTIYNPYKKYKIVDERRRYILKQMLENGYISKEKYSLSREEKVSLVKFTKPFRAPHFCFYIKNKLSRLNLENVLEVRTTLDYSIQKKVESILNNHLDTLRGNNVNNAACVVLDATTGDIVCMVGSADYYNRDDDGQVNGALSLRQPGSSLKPFLYAY
ncbi:MAG: transglycosylase domain-containing protein, partial [Spirochaetes bacterium]|nr:transglycosylase domain-containing protein [Spirochaetota bacterium]